MASGHPLQAKRRPKFEEGPEPLALVDAFAGTGGLTLGVALAAREAGRGIVIPLAIDFEQSAVDAFRVNFPSSNAVCAPVESFFDSDIGRPLSRSERRTQQMVGDVDMLVGGPPCQGHSNLNNHTRRKDPKNRLYLRMVRAAEVLAPRVVLIENVPAVVHDSEHVVETATNSLASFGYHVAHRVVPLSTFGVPQKRKRHILVAIREDALLGDDNVEDFIADGGHRPRTLRWAIRDLMNTPSDSAYDEASRPSADNLRRMKYLLDHEEYDLPNKYRPPCHQSDDHTYQAMYGRLYWDEPSPTITSGFGSMGRGRFMHPERQRCLTPHEAARIQGFPDYFKLDLVKTRDQLTTIIGNAVPPQLTQVVVRRLLRSGVLGL